MNLPSREECLSLINKYEPFPKIVGHVLAVEKVSNYIATELKNKKNNVNINLVDRAAILHDIAKSNEIRMKDRTSGVLHGQLGYDILVKEGYPEIAEIVKKHVLTALLEYPLDSWTWEEKIVQYADDRVEDEQVVKLDERFKTLVQRYGKFKSAKEKIIEAKAYVKIIEKEIFDIIGGSPDDLLRLNKC